MDLGLAGTAVAITGASRGIGAAVARAFAAEGVGRLELVSRTDADLKSLAAAITEQCGTRIDVHALDVGAAADRDELCRRIGTVDILVNNAGAVPAGRLVGADLDTWKSSWELKVWGFVDLTQRMLERMSAGHGGVIVNNIGVAGERPDPAYVAGTAANAALIALTRAVGADSLDAGVRILGVNPGLVETDRIRQILGDRAHEQFGDRQAWRRLTEDRPGGRLATPQEIADSIVFLASERSSYTSGTVLTIDGGFSAQGRTF